MHQSSIAPLNMKYVDVCLFKQEGSSKIISGTTPQLYLCNSFFTETQGSTHGNVAAETNVQSEKLNLILNPNKQTERQEKILEAKKDYADNFGDVDLQKAYDSLFEILWYSQLPCYDVKDVTSNARDQMSIIKRCFWKGRPISCPAIFKTLPTDRGMCCSFNMEMAEEIFQKSRYADVVQARQMSDTENRFVFYLERTYV